MSAPKFSSIFFGTPAFALPSLEAAVATTQVVAVVTQPDKARGRGQKVLACEVKERALALGLRCFSMPSLRKESDELRAFLALAAQARPDLFLVTAYGNLLPQNVLDLPRLGSINVHASLLPRWRGAAPLQRALEAGDTETGVCLQKVVFELDAGDLLAESPFALDRDIHVDELSSALSDRGGALLRDYLAKLGSAGTAVLSGKAQDPAGITYAKKLTKEEARWSSSWTPWEAHNRIRAFSAWPTVKARWSEGPDEIKILRSRWVEEGPRGLAAGELQVAGGQVFLGGTVRPGEESPAGALQIDKIQFPGRAPSSAFDSFQNVKKAIRFVDL